MERVISKYGQKLGFITFLRAVSIILVLIAHNPFFSFKIGVIGVDIFFLISGFLISKQLEQLLTEKTSGSYLKEFYFRRIRRILPSLISSLTIVLLLFNFSTSLSFYTLVKNASLPALLFFANFYQIANLTEYFDFALLNPISSFWSLSIEEQLYLFLPIILLLFWRYKISRFLLALLLAIPSLFYILLYSGPDKYFQPLGRLFPFSLGLLLTYIFNLKKPIFVKFRLNKISYLSLLSTYLVLILKAPIAGYPDIRVLFPLLLTAYYIYSNLADVDLLKNEKVDPVSNFLGLRSYNIYLLYLPLTALTQIWVGATKLSFIVGIVLTLIMGNFLYFFDNFHRVKIKNFKTLALAISLNILLFAIVFNLPHFGTSRQSSTTTISTLASLNSNIEYSLNYGFKSKDISFYQPQRETKNVFKSATLNLKPSRDCQPLTLCSTATSRSTSNVLILADSSAGPLTPFLFDLAREKNAQLYWFNMTGCDPAGLPLDDWNVTDGITTKRCLEFYKTLEPVLKNLKEQGNLSIIYQQASSPLRTLNRTEIKPEVKREYYIKNIKLLKKYSSNITLISEVAFRKSDPVECLSRVSNSKECSFSPTNPLNNALSVENKKIAKNFNINYIDLRQFTCVSNRCPLLINNILVYRDTLHLTTPYIDSIRTLLYPLFKIE